MKRLSSLWAGITLLALHFAAGTAVGQEKINFEDHVKPILRDKCLSCHNTNKKSSDLDLSSYSSLMQGGASGASIQPGDSGASYMYSLMSHQSEPFMPPNADKLPDETLEIVRKWIEGGAPETASSKVMLPKKNNAALTVNVSAGARPEGPAPMPDVLNLEPVVRTAATTAVSAIATNPWSKLVAVAGQKQVVLYHTETLEQLGVLPFPEGRPRVLKFSRNGGLLLAGGGRGASKGLCVVWDIRSGERVMTVGDELDEVLAADISADQTLVALGGPQKVVRVYSTATGELAYECKKHTDWIYSLEFSPDGVLLATADRSGGLLVWEAQTGREYLTLNGHTGAVNSVSWRIDGNVRVVTELPSCGTVMERPCSVSKRLTIWLSR
jgi:WD40 repeat protein